MRRHRLGVATISLSLLLGGCGTSHPKPVARARREPSPSTMLPGRLPTPTISSPSTVNTLPSTGNTSPGASKAPVSSIVMCEPDALALYFLFNAQTTMNQSGAFFSFVNTGATPCWMQGYPGVEALTMSGAVMPQAFERGVAYAIPEQPCACRVTVSPGGRIYFAVGYAPVNMPEGGSEAGCIESAELLVYPPNTTSQLEVAFDAMMCPGHNTVGPVGPASAFGPSGPELHGAGRVGS